MHPKLVKKSDSDYFSQDFKEEASAGPIPGKNISISLKWAIVSTIGQIP